MKGLSFTSFVSYVHTYDSEAVEVLLCSSFCANHKRSRIVRTYWPEAHKIDVCPLAARQIYLLSNKAS